MVVMMAEMMVATMDHELVVMMAEM